MEHKTENQICTAILDQAFKIHPELRPGLLKSVYEKSFQYGMMQAGFDAQIDNKMISRKKTQRHAAEKFLTAQIAIGSGLDLREIKTEYH